MAAKSTTIKQKVLALAVWLVGTEGACDACKKVGVTAKCTYGTGAREARAGEAHRSNRELSSGGSCCRDDKK